MNNLDDLLTFLFEFKNDDRMSFYKRMRHGFRFYHIDFKVDKEDNSKSYYDDYMRILIDTRNECIEVSSGMEEDSGILVEDKVLVKKWADILENHISINLDEKIVGIFEKSFKTCVRKDIYREYQMRKMGFIDETEEEQ